MSEVNLCGGESAGLLGPSLSVKSLRHPIPTGTLDHGRIPMLGMYPPTMSMRSSHRTDEVEDVIAESSDASHHLSIGAAAVILGLVELHGIVIKRIPGCLHHLTDR